MMPTLETIAALDVGEKRVGIAVASLSVRLPRPLSTITRGDNFFAELTKLLHDEAVGTLVIGYPRGLDGQHTAQTATIEAFAQELKQYCDLPQHFQDEALTSRQAEEELESRGKPYAKGEIDALAATYILQDYLLDHAPKEQAA